MAQNSKIEWTHHTANRWKINNFDLAVGDHVVVPSVRSNHLDYQNGIGWIAFEVIVTVSKINDLTFCYKFNNELHYELKNDVKKTKSNPNMFGEIDKVRYAKDGLAYRLKVEYSV
jgi:hypothetical protein